MKRRIAVLVIALALVAFFVLVPVVPLIPNNELGTFVGYGESGAYYSYRNQTIIYYSHVASSPFSNQSAPEYLPMPTFGSLSYYFFSFGGVAFKSGYNLVSCATNSPASVYCQQPVPCFTKNSSWTHKSCF